MTTETVILSSCHLVTLSSLVPACPVDMAHELGAGLWVGAEYAAHRRGDHRGVGLLDPTHHRAEMHTLGHDGDTQRLQRRVDEIGDLDGHALLDLEAAGEHLDDPRDF